MVYNKRLLEKTLANKSAAGMLGKNGYPRPLTLAGALRELEKRFGKNGEFPHEIGVFLGYPVYDVYQFVKQGGKNYAASGYWKVYRDKECALKTFEMISKCKERFCRRLDEGYSITQLVKAV